MKKLGLSITAIFLSIGLAFSQPVSDMGIIPVGVTLNSILRLNIVSGGNIEFVVNTIDQYTNGVANTPLYTTNFTVASSVDFDVRMYAENAGLSATDNPANPVMNLGNVGYWITEQGATYASPNNWTINGNGTAASVTDVLTSVPATDIITGVLNKAAGDVTENDFSIHWELATANVIGVSGLASLLTQSLAADRYVVNVFLVLEAH